MQGVVFGVYFNDQPYTYSSEEGEMLFLDTATA